MSLLDANSLFDGSAIIQTVSSREKLRSQRIFSRERHRAGEADYTKSVMLAELIPTFTVTKQSHRHVGSRIKRNVQISCLMTINFHSTFGTVSNEF
jgi:hypothetical protein